MTLYIIPTILTNFKLVRVDVHADYALGACRLTAKRHSQADSAETPNGAVGASVHLGRV